MQNYSTGPHWWWQLYSVMNLDVPWDHWQGHVFSNVNIGRAGRCVLINRLVMSSMDLTLSVYQINEEKHYAELHWSNIVMNAPITELMSSFMTWDNKPSWLGTAYVLVTEIYTHTHKHIRTDAHTYTLFVWIPRGWVGGALLQWWKLGT